MLFSSRRIFHIEIEAFLEVLDVHFPSNFAFLSVTPPIEHGFEFVGLDGFGFGVAFLAFGEAVLVIPDVFGGSAFFEEEEVGRDGGGVEGGLGKTDDGVEIALGEELFADALLVAVSGDAAIRQDNGAAAPGLEELDHEDDEEVGGFLAAEGGGEVGLDTIGDAGSERRIGEDDLDLLLGTDGVVFGGEAVGVVPVRDIDAVEDEVGEAEDV